MKIGMIVSYYTGVFDSLKRQFGASIDALRGEHELIYCPTEYLVSSKARQRGLLKEMILSSDVLLGNFDGAVLQARRDAGKQIPYVCYLCGTMPRGAINLMDNHRLLDSTDILVGNCVGDIELIHKFFRNAQARLLPFVYNDSDFYPLDDSAKQAARAKMGFDSKDKILLYSGRVTLEKNLHTTLRIFSLIQRLIPNARLIVAGRCEERPFMEFGSCSLGIRSMMERAIAKLGIDQDSVRLIGHKTAAELLELYNIADLVVNMTLHHDENFGLAQVEAMACGTPVIGSNWGGLKDTIVDGETGYRISTLVTGSGVKLNWWEAVNKIVSLLESGPELTELRRKCRESVSQRYSLSQHRRDLEAILADCHGKSEIASEPLQASEFAQQFWNSCAPILGVEGEVSYKYGVSPDHMYRELIGPYAGTLHGKAAGGRRLKPDQVLCLTAPLLQYNERSIEINDPIFPLNVTIPAEICEAVNAVIGAMREEPAITVKRLNGNYLAGLPNVSRALEWMAETGLILKNDSQNGDLSPSSIGHGMSLPLFSIQRINSSTDIMILP